MAWVKALAGRSIAQHTSPNRGGAMSDHRGVVLHIAQGSYGGTVSWQMNPDQRYADGTEVTTCSTWIVGREVGEWAQMVDSDLIAWCQRDGSRSWLSIELAGFTPAAPTAWQVEACAQLLAWVHGQHGVPLAVADHPGERGLGHHAMDREWLGENWGHDECPGAGVIGAKAAIVARAKEIVEGDDMQLQDELTRPDGRETTVGAALVWTLEHAGDVKAEVAKLRAEVAALHAAVAGDDQAAAVRATIREEFAALGPALVAELDGVTVEQMTAALARLRLVDAG